MKLEIPEFSLVLLVGISGAGKSTFANRFFAETEVLSSDAFRAMVCDDESSLEATTDAFNALHHLAEIRLRRGKLTVIDATNVQAAARKPLFDLANKWHAMKVVICLATPEQVCEERNSTRPNRDFPNHVLRSQNRQFSDSLRQLKREKVHQMYVLSPRDHDHVVIERTRIWSRRPDEKGPFDIVGDVHGCYEELTELMVKLGWQEQPEWHHPEGRKLFFVGDLVDRGPKPVEVLRLAMDLVKSDKALAVPGNHDIKLVRALDGRQVQRTHGLAETMEALEAEPEEFREEVREFLKGLVSHAVVDEGRLCVAHAGLREEMQGRGSGAVREFCLYGETTGEIDEFGLPVRSKWAKEYRGKTMVVFGHTPVPEPEWLNNTIDIDTGCCFGGKLTALRYPERQIVQVPAKRVYAEPVRPIAYGHGQLTGQQELDTLLEYQDVVGKRYIEVPDGTVKIAEENAIAALEIMSRFAADPRWVVYIPPTMSPCETSKRDGFLEYPDQALTYYRNRSIDQVVCEEKHMGSRAVVVVCKDPSVARTRFGFIEESWGTVLTRTGRPFFDDVDLQEQMVERVSRAAAPLFETLESDWLVLDCELMPWSAKAQGLIKTQYAGVGASSRTATSFEREVVQQTLARGVEVPERLVQRVADRADAAQKFTDAYRRYCWPVDGLDGYRLAPFHIMASEGAVHTQRDHQWHLDLIAKLCAGDESILLMTPYRVVNLASEQECLDVCAWWEAMVSAGGEGMVVKPMAFRASDENGLMQPAVKCRGPEYLRIIYGPDYLEPSNLEKLRKRGLSRKRSMAIREYQLGEEALHRFVRREPLRRVHECVFGVLALESQPIDPRL